MVEAALGGDEVMSYGDIAWVPLTVGLTVLGFILTYFA
jgi:hypothetical protein